MQLQFNFKLLTICIIILHNVLSERILLLAPQGSKSHKIFYMGIAEPLARRGHQITVVSSYKPTNSIPNIREVIIKGLDIDELLSSTFDKPSDAIKKVMFNSPTLCSETLAEKDVQDLKKEQFDLIMISFFISDCYLSFVHHFKVPLIYLIAGHLSGPFIEMIGGIDFPSIAPNKLIWAKFPMTFTERFRTVVLNEFFNIALKFYITPNTERVCREKGLCPEDMPPLSEIKGNASLIIVNSVRALETPPRPMMPNVIYAGGASIKPPKKLPQDLEKWVEDSGEDGFIFFSIGSALRPSILPERCRKILVEVFGSLKQKVLWKWDEESMPDLPKNVKLSKWLPQPDILGHPKLRLFITHGGMLSTLESTYNGVPVIGMPVFGDQFPNIQAAENEGWAKSMNWEGLDEDVFRKLIIDTINDESLREVSQRRSKLMRDAPISPSEEATFWVEYVIRHKGAPHLISLVRFMRLYEVYNMDVWAVIVGTLLGIFYCFYQLLKLILRKCMNRFRESKNKKE